MYVWVVLTTFLAMLAAYVLPIRADSDKLVDVPVAQAKLMQLVVKQKAGLQYVKENQWPYAGSETDRVQFRTIELADGIIDDYLPFGFVNNNDFVTMIYCLNEGLTEIREGEDSCDNRAPTSSKRMVITYGAIPEKWQTVVVDGDVVKDVRPSGDMMMAMRGHFASTEKAGYTVVEGGVVKIVNYEGEKFDIPEVVVNDELIASYGLGECIDDYRSCLVYMEFK